MKLLLPVLIIILGIALFFGLTQPLLSSGSTADPGIAELKQEKEVLESALNTARLAAEKLTVLETQYNAITEEQKAALENVLPNTIDEVRLIIYVQNIGVQNKTPLKGVSVAQAANGSAAQNVPSETGVALVAAGYEPVSISFTVKATYNQFLSLVEKMEKSLKIFDITSVEFSSADVKGTYEFKVAAQVYRQP